MRYQSNILILATILLSTAFGMAADLTGRVVNGTTRKPASADEVVLLRLSQDEGMSETARTRADNRGQFRFPLTDQQATYVVRAIHQGVTYHIVAKPGIRNLVLEVYDVANQLADATSIMDVERLEAIPKLGRLSQSSDQLPIQPWRAIAPTDEAAIEPESSGAQSRWEIHWWALWV